MWANGRSNLLDRLGGTRRREIDAVAKGSEEDDGIAEAIGDDDDRPIPIFPLGQRSHGLLGSSEGVVGIGPQISEPKVSTPLDSSEPEEVIPSMALWAMKYLRHRWFDSSSDTDAIDHIRWKSANGDEPAVYVIDDGYEHCMVTRFVGSSPDGCTYCLVARITRWDFEEARNGEMEPSDLFSLAKGFTLCGVLAGSVSNVVRVASYRRLKDVPSDFLPPSEFIEFAEAP
jgi:hypothetical protein